MNETQWDSIPDKPAADVTQLESFIRKYAMKYDMEDFLTDDALEEFKNLLLTAHPRVSNWMDKDMSIHKIIEALKRITAELKLDFAQLMIMEIEDEDTTTKEAILQEFKTLFKTTFIKQ